MAENSLIRTISSLSLGLILVLAWAFLWIRADILFPVNTEVWRINYILTFIILISFVFAWDTVTGSNTEKQLFRVSFIKKFPVFLIFALITVSILFVFSSLLNPTSTNTIQSALAQVSLGVIVLHALMISIGEELVFRGWLPERVRERGQSRNVAMWVSTIIFAVFHAGMGKSILTLITYIPLGLIFFQIKMRYSPKTNMANAGTHFGWNLFILGFLI